jgi:DnaK suppressor protein
VAVKKAAVKKAAPKPVAPKAAVVKKVAPKNPALKKPAAKKPANSKPVARKAVVQKGKAGSMAPAKATVAAPPAGKPSPVAASKPAAPVAKNIPPPPASKLFKGKVASATAMVTPQLTPSAARHTPPQKHQKNLPSSMNKLATKQLENGVTREDGRYALPSTSIIALPKGYRPSSDEEYMNPLHLAYFRNKLRDWREQLVEESRQTMDNLRDEVRDVGDEAERATRETENSLELRTRDRYRKLISKIDKALRRIEDGSYGFCEETDEEIGVDRLDARPIATLSLDAQERREHLQKQMGD